MTFLFNTHLIHISADELLSCWLLDNPCGCSLSILTCSNHLTFPSYSTLVSQQTLLDMFIFTHQGRQHFTLPVTLICRVIELQLLYDTYFPETVRALATIRLICFFLILELIWTITLSFSFFGLFLAKSYDFIITTLKIPLNLTLFNQSTILVTLNTPVCFGVSFLQYFFILSFSIVNI